MEGWQIAVVVKPLVLLVFLFSVRLFAHFVENRMPDSRLKRVLFFSWRA